MLNGKFVPSRPEGPTDRSQAHPKNTSGNARQIISKSPELRERSRVPGHLKPLFNTTPDQLSQDIMKEDMSRILQVATQGTEL